MKTAKNDLTLKNIAKVIDKAFDRKFDEKFDKTFDRKLAPIDGKITGIYGELDAIKQQGAETNLDIKILRREMKQGFDGVYDALDGITHTLDRDLEPRIKKLENRVFAQ